MLFETLSQTQIFWNLALIGFVSGFIFDLSTYVVFLCKKNKIVKILFDFFATILVFLCFYFIVSKIDYGTIRLYHLFAFFAFFAIQRISLGKIIAKFFDWCYNIFIKTLQKILKREKHSTKDDKTTKSKLSV